MELELGRHTLDVTTGALVLAFADDDGAAGQISAIVNQRPAAVAIHDGAQLKGAKAVFDGPLIIRSTDATIVEKCLRDGAEVAHDPSGLADPNYLRVVEEAGAAIVVGSPCGVSDHVAFLSERARWAEAAGIAKASVILDATGASSDERSRLGVLGHVLMITATTELEAAGLHIGHVIDAARIITVINLQAPGRTSMQSSSTATVEG